MKKKLLASVLLGVSLVTMGALASAAEPLPAGTTTLEAVDGVTAVATSGGQPTLRVEGVVQGESQAREFDLLMPSASDPVGDRCTKLLLLSQTHPGRYEVVITTYSPTYNLVHACKLKSR